jgi:hypothetical protein
MAGELSSLDRARLRVEQITERLQRHPQAARDGHLAAALEDLTDILAHELEPRLRELDSILADERTRLGEPLPGTCDECGAQTGGELVSRKHWPECSLHPDALVTG